jgi:hypothetical protein
MGDYISNFFKPYSKIYQRDKETQKKISSWDEAWGAPLPRITQQSDSNLTHDEVPPQNKRITSARVTPTGTVTGPFPEGGEGIPAEPPIRRPNPYPNGLPEDLMLMNRDRKPVLNYDPLAANKGVSEVVPEMSPGEAEGVPGPIQPTEDAKPQTLSQRWANLDDATKRRLGLSALVTGLGIMSKQKYSTMPQSPLADIGEGGLMGVKTYLTLEQQDEQNRLKGQELIRRTSADLATAADRGENRRIQGDRNRILELATQNRMQWQSSESPLGKRLIAGAELAKVQAGREPTATVPNVEVPGKGTGTAIVETKTGKMTAFIPTGEKTIPVGTMHSYLSGPEGKTTTSVWQGKDKGWVDKTTGKPASAAKAAEATGRWEYKTALDSVQKSYSTEMGNLQARIITAMRSTNNLEGMKLAQTAGSSEALLAALSGAKLPGEMGELFTEEIKKNIKTYRDARGEVDKYFKKKSWWDESKANEEQVSTEVPASAPRIETPAEFKFTGK